MAYDFGSALGKGIERGAESIAGGMREKFKKQYEAQKEKTNRAREEYMFLMQQGGTPTAEMAQTGQFQPGFQKAVSPIIQQSQESMARKTEEFERKGRATESQISLRGAQKSALERGQYYMDPVTGEMKLAPPGTKLLPNAKGTNAQILKDKKKLDGLGGVVSYMEKSLNGKTTGRIVGNLKNVQSFFGKNADVSTYNALVQASIGPIARVISGEVGVLTDKDIARAEKMLPTTTDTEEEVTKKIQQLRDLIEIRRNTIKEGSAVSEKLSKEDLYNQLEAAGLSENEIAHVMVQRGY